MAQSAVGRLFRCQNSSYLRQSIGSITQYRTYSHNAIPTFPPTSSPELDQALKRFREELFIPFGLNTEQRRLMFRRKYAEKLEQQPVTINIGDNDEPYQLRPMDPMARPPKKEFKDVVLLMKTRKDWQNLAPFLGGLQMSKRPLSLANWEWTVRKAGEADAVGAILECAKQSERTGLRLDNIGIVQRIFFELHKKAQKGQFKDPAVSKALGMAKQFAALMEAPEHSRKNVQNIKEDPKRQPFVIGTLLELSAARAVNELGGKDESGDVYAYAQRLMANWEAGNFSRDVTNWFTVDRMLQENVPIYNGITLALQVEGVASDKTVSGPLKRRLNNLRLLIANHKEMAPENVQQKPTLGYQQSQLLH
ncbi:hypothetical protein LV164_003497 [Aspergillus fumigatus]|nr:hypothetical protein KXX42_008576 [Aspergillus fumigatus]KAH1544747.1 hypothetical protein KXX57_005294 [Aspergillus fumigatus]KAH2315576.1 hypothetical protein KXV47_001824 [Aspergillus fumigatus]KAH2675078.1 hypothetical protein KXV32_005102 [Aspergillus fumigatus]KAH2908290.1 hypothetical protein KXW25_004997 [Aspergillus fumigatus]